MDAGTDFADEADIAPWASTAVDWARASSILNGRDGNRFAPQDSASRADAAEQAGVNYFDLFVGTPSTQEYYGKALKGREVRSMTQAERDAYPTKQELYNLCGEMGVPIVAMKPFAVGNILKGHEDGWLKGLIELTPVQCISYILSIPQVACPVPGFASVDELLRQYSGLSVTAESCLHCGACSKRCPFGIDAERNIHRAQDVFGF